jgi:hypothetical protein
MVTLVEDHILPKQKDKAEDANGEDPDNLNDRVDDDCIASIKINQEDEPLEVRVIEQEDDDNMLRNKRTTLEFQDIPEIES